MNNTNSILQFFKETRTQTENICQPLEIEDYVVQPAGYVSPPKWHLAHTSWFFETFILMEYKKGYTRFQEIYAYLFNSYYNNVGHYFLRPNRGNLSRPTVKEIYEYRHHITKAIIDLLSTDYDKSILPILITGIHHEKQHQELLYTDIKYILGNNPIFPKYNDEFEENPIQNEPQKWIQIKEGIYEIGHDNPEKFCYDNELGRHKVYLNSYQLSNCLVTNEEYLEFIKAGRYKDFNLWHANGLKWKNENNITAPLYWFEKDGKWFQYTLQGLQEINRKAPVSHVSYYEAFAYAQWKGCRLPTEFEWETAHDKILWGSRWEWTESSYLPYPNFKKLQGALGEYNGKFMVGQKVLRGQSVATANHHIRPTYRNYFYPHERWQFKGIRLAK